MWLAWVSRRDYKNITLVTLSFNQNGTSEQLDSSKKLTQNLLQILMQLVCHIFTYNCMLMTWLFLFNHTTQYDSEWTKK